MIIDLTMKVENTNHLIQWAKSQDNKFIAMGHIGTHLDTYQKSNIPLQYFKSKGIVFDVRGINEVKVNDIDLEQIEQEQFVLFRTGQSEKYSYGEKEYFDNHPQLSHELIEKLINKKIRFIGMDCAGIRQNSEHEKADKLCEDSGIYVIENLKDLGNVICKDFVVYTMWLDDDQMTGLKCKVIADLNV